MQESELQQYLLRNYPQENARCEWKEFKNLKNSFCGDEKNDVISYVSAIANMEGGHLVIGVHDSSLEIVGTDTYNYDRQKAILRLTERCVNLSTEGLDIEEFITDDTNKKVWVITSLIVKIISESSEFINKSIFLVTHIRIIYSQFL